MISSETKGEEFTVGNKSLVNKCRERTAVMETDKEKEES